MKEEVVMHMHNWNNYREQLVAGVGWLTTPALSRGSRHAVGLTGAAR
jgi:hypothetical protein